MSSTQVDATGARATDSRQKTALVIGAGQAGGPLAGALAKAGWDVTLVEREHVGGTCVNEGCTPTKTLIASARAAHVARSSGPLGVQAQPEVDFAGVMARVQRTVDSFRDGSAASVLAAGVRLIYGEASFTGPHEVRVALRGGGQQTLQAEHILINTGASPTWPDLEGLDTAQAITSSGALKLQVLPQRLLVLGGGYISLELAQAFARLGSRVTVVEHGDRLLPREDADVAAELRRVLEGEGIQVLTGHTAQKVRREGGQTVMTVQDTGGHTAELSADVLLVATGRSPNTQGLNLEAAGVATDDHGYVVADEHLRTSVAHIHALGDVKGGPAFTHVSYDDYRIVRDALMDDKRRSTADRLVPYTLFTDPQLGRVGMNAQEAERHTAPTRIYTLPMSRVARAIEIGETAGLMRAVVDDETDLLLGVCVLGPGGGELLGALQFAMMGGLSASTLRNATIAHPTLCESVNNLFMSVPRKVEGRRVEGRSAENVSE
ncbi:mercuric reductase [Deinococcus sp.]|uniref:mercuric reductase n=1 Tax=Deinococcus sp. TaxID=47478 RepID=UPI00286D8362|nr:mercuric reductase [Deinococcus sp.]